MTGNTESINNNSFGIPVDKVTDQPNSLFKPLPEKLLKDGWVLDKNEILIPYNDDNIYWSCRVNHEIKNDKRMKKWVISWKYYTENENYPIGEEFYGNIFINRTNPKSDKEIGNRNKVMGYITKKYELPRGHEKVRGYWDSQVPDLNRYQIKQLLLDNWNQQGIIEEVEEKPQHPETFGDYSEFIQKEAIKIIEKNQFYDELLNGISWKHEGDRKTAELLLLSCASVYIKEPVHQILNAKAGKGKTDIFNRVKEAQPTQYIKPLSSFSPKALFYATKDENLNFFSLYNILIVDDVKLSNDEIIQILKLLLDNERKEKEHITVTDQKAELMKLEGHFLGLINKAKDELDRELGDRCYLNSLEDDKEKNVKNKIKEVSIRNLDLLHERKNEILRACYQYHIDKEIKVYNPLLMFLNVQDHDNRNIKHYIGFMKSMTFYNYNKRQTIDNITIGSNNDIEMAYNIISEGFKVQKDKLTDTQKRIIDELYVNPENNTRSKLVSALGLGKTTIADAIRDYDDKIGLKSLGYIEENITENQYDPNIITFKKHYKESNEENTLNTLTDFITFHEKNPLFIKKAILIDFIHCTDILINERVCIYITHFLEKNKKTILNSYTDLCKFINSFNKYIKENNNDLINLKGSKISMEDLNFHYEKIHEIEKYIFNNSKKGSKRSLAKPTKNTLNSNQRKNILITDETVQTCPDEISNGDLRKFIHKEFFEITTKPKKNNEILLKNKIIGMIPKPENIGLEDFLRIVEKELKYLKSKGFIEIDNITHKVTVLSEFLDYYKENLEGLTYED